MIKLSWEFVPDLHCSHGFTLSNLGVLMAVYITVFSWQHCSFAYVVIPPSFQFVPVIYFFISTLSESSLCLINKPV